MELPIFHVDAFASRVFAGNPAAVVPVPAASPLSDDVMQAIAAENALSETAFLLPARDEADYSIRWFTPVTEVELCGHATLASALVVFRFLEPARTRVRFASASGVLTAEREGEQIAITLPALPPSPLRTDEPVGAALGKQPRELGFARDVLAVYETADEVAGLAPDMAKLRALPWFGFIATAPGKDCDFVSRFFAPKEGIDEDPVTGSAHCTLGPYWAARLGKKTLSARQLSKRGGELRCEVRDEGVRLVGGAALYLSGTIRVP